MTGLRHPTLSPLPGTLMCLLAFMLLAVPPSILLAQTPPGQPAPPVNPAVALASMTPEMRGDLFMVQHRYVAALDSYQSIPLKSAAVWNKAGMAYHHLFALDEARKRYEAALKLEPRYAEALNNLGAVYHGQRDYRAAERTYKRAIKYQPNSAVAYCNLGTTYFAEHKDKQGIKAYQKAFAVDPRVFDPGQSALVESGSSATQRAAVNYSMAKLYAHAGNRDLALAALRKALSSGFKDRKRLMEDSEFASIRDTVEFQKLMSEQHME